MRSSGCTFVTALKQILQPIREFTQSYVDDMAVHSDNWRDHLSHVERFLSVIKESGFTLGLNKCQFGKNEIKFVGHIIGSGKRRADPSKIATVNAIKEPETKKQVRQMLGFLCFLRVSAAVCSYC